MTHNLRFGFRQDQWDRVREELRGLLIDQARVGRDLTYSDVVRKLTMVRFDPDSNAFLVMLGEISIEEHDAGRGILSVMVVNRETATPGQGFFNLAKTLGHHVDDKLAFWIAERNKVIDTWSNIV